MSLLLLSLLTEAVVESQRLPERFEHPPIRLEVWELGVHASLSAEAGLMLGAELE